MRIKYTDSFQGKIWLNVSSIQVALNLFSRSRPKYCVMVIDKHIK